MLGFFLFFCFKKVKSLTPVVAPIRERMKKWKQTRRTRKRKVKKGGREGEKGGKKITPLVKVAPTLQRKVEDGLWKNRRGVNRAKRQNANGWANKAKEKKKKKHSIAPDVKKYITAFQYKCMKAITERQHSKDFWIYTFQTMLVLLRRLFKADDWSIRSENVLGGKNQWRIRYRMQGGGKAREKTGKKRKKTWAVYRFYI